MLSDTRNAPPACAAVPGCVTDQVDGAHPSRPAPEAPTEQAGLKAAKWVVALLPFCEGQPGPISPPERHTEHPPTGADVLPAYLRHPVRQGLGLASVEDSLGRGEQRMGVAGAAEDTHCQAVLQDTVLAVLGRAPASKRLARLLAEHLDYEATVTGCKGKWHGLQTRLVEHNPAGGAVCLCGNSLSESAFPRSR